VSGGWEDYLTSFMLADQVKKGRCEWLELEQMRWDCGQLSCGYRRMARRGCAGGHRVF
jgi:hypothetical protein